MTGRSALTTHGGEAAVAFERVAAIPAPDLGHDAVAEFAEQLALDVASMDDVQRGAFFAAVGDQAFAVVQRIYVHDFVPRVERVLDDVFGASDWAGPPLVEPFETVAAQPPQEPPVETPADTWALLEEFMVVVARLRSLDPRTTELVRLRGARLHDCAVCKSRRSQDAIDAGATGDEFAAVDAWDSSDLPASAKAALALTDAMVLGAAVPADVREHLTDAQVVEVVLDVMRNAANKIAVSLGADAATVTEGVELFTTDADGNLEVVGTAGSNLG
ncbi:carboxymuconolactone decarboxylase family protein [Nocardioides marmorisolisilvae]|uniref:Carboxymuconolactone decarboxylase family protein n=1 Tax=Nocardioides marmorisolisilvae TaxID=1542737 RepID=A0A3N0E0K4_9ACTN|nr:carboxymuconolactone decarboxylase family protein [Nocardioides marmorisolisilvae]RNL81372.1 carboxymuconolactone decarboxylase family protein [Nocardioides marmorisolisilvae]